MNPTQQPQITLRDIHLPDPVSWWPPAPGWWILLSLLILFTIATLWGIRRYHRRSYRRLALRQLDTLKQNVNQQQDGQQHDDQQLIQQLSQLLRHIAVLHYPPQQCAGLHGKAWLEFLDQPFGATKPFSTGAGQCLANGPYQPYSEQLDAVALLQLSRRWLKRLPLPLKQRRTA